MKKLILIALFAVLGMAAQAQTRSQMQDSASKYFDLYNYFSAFKRPVDSVSLKLHQGKYTIFKRKLDSLTIINQAYRDSLAAVAEKARLESKWSVSLP